MGWVWCLCFLLLWIADYNGLWCGMRSSFTDLVVSVPLSAGLLRFGRLWLGVG